MLDQDLITTAQPDEYSAGAMVYRRAIKSDDSTLNLILQQTPMTSWVTLSTEHEPSYFASQNMFGNRQTLLAYRRDETQTTVGMCSFTELPLHINGYKTTAAYLGELRVLPAFRNKPGIVRSGFKAIEKIAATLSTDAHWFTSIASENVTAKRLLEANLEGMPIYQPRGEMLSMALSTRTSRNSSIMQRAQKSDIPALVEFYNRQAREFEYSPVLSENWLAQLDGSNGLHLDNFWLLKNAETIQACFALWDQRDFKQTVVRGYRFPLNMLRQPYNILSSMTGRVNLPAIGEPIDYLFIAFLAIDIRTLNDIRPVIDSALALIISENVDIGMLGLSLNNPLIEQLKRYPKQTYQTCIERVSWPDVAEPPSLKSISGPDIVQPEIALL